MFQNIANKDCYRPSASVIIAASTDNPENGYDYNLLLFKRTFETSFAPEHCVFPGGVLDVCDESIEWLKYFKEFGITEHELQDLVVISENRPQFLSPQGSGCYDRFFKKSKIWARDVSLRITALRETFEEVGVLLCRNRSSAHNTRNVFGQAYENFDRKYWQQLVHNDASQFLELCRKLDVVPDLWCLQEWSAWRSPATASKKYETVYYFVALKEVPNLVPESSEVALTMWNSPDALLRKFDKKIIWLPFIIFYELARLTNAKNLQNLFNFAYRRCRNHTTTLLMPAYYKCSDGMVGVLPGDDAFPPDPSVLTETTPINMTVSEFRKGTKNRHRIVLRDMHNLHVDINMSIDGHFCPTSRINKCKL